MTRVRSLRHDDLPQVVALYRAHLAVPNLAGEHELGTAFEQVFLGEPLSDPSIPSLVFEGCRRRDPRLHRVAGASDAVRAAARASGVQQLAGRLAAKRDNSAPAACCCGSTSPVRRTSP